MSNYEDHDTLTQPRLAKLRQIAIGSVPTVQQNQLRWFVSHGYMSVSVADMQMRTVTLSTSTWTVLCMPDDPTPRKLRVQNSGYTPTVTDPSKITAPMGRRR